MKHINLLILLILVSFIPLHGQHNPDELEQVKRSESPVNPTTLLLHGVKIGELTLVEFVEFGGDHEEISVGMIRIFEEDISEWDEADLYYEGDLVMWEGKEYLSKVDNNEGSQPDELVNWTENEQIWSVIDDANWFYTEKDEAGNPTYFHLYFKDGDEPPLYFGSVEASSAAEYLNNTGILWYKANESGHLQGSVFLELPTEILIKTANNAGLDLTEEDISYEDRVIRWWATTRNYALKENDNFRFLYADDSIMWETSIQEVVDMATPNSAEFILLGDALISGVVFGSSDDPIESAKVEKIQTSVIERFFALDSMFLVENTSKVSKPVSTSGIATTDWASLVEKMLEGAKNGEWTPYTSYYLDNEMTIKDLDFRMMLYEEEAVDFAFEYDQWNKNVTYYFEDMIEYAGILYESLKENNVDHIPEQWPEYWREVVVNTESYYPDELRNVKVKSKLVFDSLGNVLSVEPEAFCLEIPGNFVVTGFNKEIAWFDLNQISESGEDSSFNRLIELIKTHDFYAELIDNSELRQVK